MPTANPDETGYLFAARVLGGGADADLSGSTFYQIGYPLLISPAFWFTGNPTTAYHLVIGINAVISALIVPLAYLAGRRFDLSRTVSFCLAQAAALLPASIFFTQFALTDAILPVVVLAWLLAIHSWLDRDSARHAVAASLLAAYAYATHSRGLIILIVQAALLAFVFARRWAPRRPAAIAGAVLLAAVAAAYAANLWLQAHTYPHGIKELGNWLSDRLTSPDGWAWTISGGLGQLWYLTVSTWGLAGVALAGAAAALGRRGADRASRPARAVAGVVLVTVLGIAFVTIAALPDERRVGNYVYGRYLACLAPALLVAGFALLARRRLLWTTAGLLLGTALIAQLHAGNRLTRYIFVPFDFPETSFLTWDWHRFRLWPATLAALALLAAVALLARRVPLAAVALLGAVGLGANITATARISDAMTEEMTASARLTSLRPADRVAVDFGVSWKIRLPQTFAVTSELGRFTMARGEQPPPGTTLALFAWPPGVQAEASWPSHPAGWHPVEAHRTTLGDWVAWRP